MCPGCIQTALPLAFWISIHSYYLGDWVSEPAPTLATIWRLTSCAAFTPTASCITFAILKGAKQLSKEKHRISAKKKKVIYFFPKKCGEFQLKLSGKMSGLLKESNKIESYVTNTKQKNFKLNP